MARDNHPKERHRKELERKQNRRASYDRILIVSEGEKTEPLYFKEIRSAFRLHTANVEVQRSAPGTAPIQVVEYAEQLLKNGNPHNGIQPGAFEQVYAVFDRDDHKTYFDALKAAASLDGKVRNDARKRVTFRAVASVPCFELWLLLHYRDVHHILHRDEAVELLKRYIPGYEKGAGGCFGATRNRIGEASQRAFRMTSRGNAFNDSEPYTAIGELVKLLMSLGS